MKNLTMNKKILLSLAIAVGVMVGTIAPVQSQAAGRCISGLSNRAQATLQDQIHDALARFNGVLMPIDAEAHAGDHLMFGFESEYVTSQTAEILKFYRPANIQRAEWMARTDAQRIEWLAQAIKNKGLGNKHSNLVKMNEDARYDFMPESPIYDDTGNLEIVLPPMDNFNVWRERVQLINEKFGAGSMQAMISEPTRFLFRGALGAQRNQKQVVGMYNFMHEFDVLERMHDGLERFDAGNPRQVLKTFAHPYLGPISRAKQTYMIQNLNQMANGQRVYFNALTAPSSKYIGSTTPRPDIGANHGRMGSEVRDAHTSQEKLIERTDRISLFYMGDRAAFEPFHGVLAVDTRADFNKLPANVQRMLRELYPTPLDQTFGAADEVFALEVFRNFSYPLKDWRPDIAALGRRDLQQRIEAAQHTYVDALKDIQNRLQQNQISAQQASALVQGACAKFSADSGLFEAYDTAYQRIATTVMASIANARR